MGDIGIAEETERGFDNPQRRPHLPPIGGWAIGKAVISTEEFVGTIEKVETHSNDPIEPPPDHTSGDAWDRLAKQFSSLGEKLKDRYQAVAGSEGPSEDEVRDALRTLGGAWDRVMDAITIASKDEEVRNSVKQAASTFTEAVGAALNEIPTFLRRNEPDSDEDLRKNGEESK